MASPSSAEALILTGLAKIKMKNPAEIRKESRLVEDLEIDSLDTLDLIFRLEEEFNIEIPQEDQLLFVTVQDVISYVEDKTGANIGETNRMLAR